MKFLSRIQFATAFTGQILTPTLSSFCEDLLFLPHEIGNGISLFSWSYTLFIVLFLSFWRSSSPRKLILSFLTMRVASSILHSLLFVFPSPLLFYAERFLHGGSMLTNTVCFVCGGEVEDSSSRSSLSMEMNTSLLLGIVAGGGVGSLISCFPLPLYETPSLLFFLLSSSTLIYALFSRLPSLPLRPSPFSSSSFPFSILASAFLVGDGFLSMEVMSVYVDSLLFSTKVEDSYQVLFLMNAVILLSALSLPHFHSRFPRLPYGGSTFLSFLSFSLLPFCGRRYVFLLSFSLLTFSGVWVMNSTTSFVSEQYPSSLIIPLFQVLLQVGRSFGPLFDGFVFERKNGPFLSFLSHSFSTFLSCILSSNLVFSTPGYMYRGDLL